MPSLRKAFGSHLRSIRESNHMSQEQFAEFIGISVDFLSLIERGINAPSFETIELISSRLKIPVARLFAFEEGDKH